MDRRSLPAVGIALVGVLALGLGAATLTSTVRQQEEGFGLGGGSGAEDPGIVPPPTPEPGSGGTPFPIPDEVILALIVVGALLTVWYLVVHLREAATTLAAAAIVVGIAVAVVWTLSELFPLGAPTMAEAGGFLFGSESGELVGQGSPTQPVLVLVLLLGAAVVGFVVVSRAADEDAEEGVEEAPTDDTATTRALGRAAGRVADRLGGDTDVDNEVYRAWREMTRLLDVDDHATTTPGEFATAAREAGMGRGDVDELTRLFEDVRYGDAPPDADRESRARTVFRRIEDTYAPDEGEEAA